jgi:hypothetical protein
VAVKKLIDEDQKDIWEETKLKPEHRYRVAAVACILVAARITQHLKLLDFDIDRIRDYLIKELTNPMNSGSVTSQSPAEGAQTRLADFLNTYQAEILTVSDKFHPGKADACCIIGKAPYGRISMRYEQATHRLYIAHETMREWCAKNQISFREFVNELGRSNMLLDDRRKITLTGGTPLVGAQGWTVELNAKHPALSGIVSLIETIVTNDEQKIRRLRDR